jgi:hypothetical protein
VGAFDPITFGSVDCTKASRVLIVATGPSVQAVPIRNFRIAADAGVHIIGVNGAVRWLPSIHTWFSCDPGPRIRPLMRRQRPGVDYYAAVPADYGSENPKFSSHRGPAERNVTFLRRLPRDISKGFRLSETPDAIRTGNSAYGALGIAYLKHAERIAIVGVDGNRQRYAYLATQPNGGFNHLPGLFRAAIPQFRQRETVIVTGNLKSNVVCFPMMDPVAAIDWLTEQ